MASGGISDEGSSQLSDFAFTPFGAAYKLDEVLKCESTPKVVTANKSSTQFLKPDAPWLNDDSRPKDFCSAEEQANPRSNETRYLVIGVIPYSSLDDKWSVYAIENGHSIGTKQPSEFLEPIEGILPLRVVTPLTTKASGEAPLYALTDVHPITKLCNVYLAPQEVIFYFANYRNSSPDISARCKEWNENVLLESVRMGVEILDGERPAGSSEKYLLEKLRFLVARYKPAPRNNGKCGIIKSPTRHALIKQFLDGTSGNEELDTEQLRRELQSLWPDIQDVSAEKLMLLRQGIVQKELFVEHDFAYAFVAIGCKNLTEDTPNLGEFASDILDTAMLALGEGHYNQRAPDADSDELLPILETIRAYSEALSKKDADYFGSSLEAGGDLLFLKKIITRILEITDADKRYPLMDQALSLLYRKVGSVGGLTADFNNCLSVLKNLRGLMDSDH